MLPAWPWYYRPVRPVNLSCQRALQGLYRGLKSATCRVLLDHGRDGMLISNIVHETLADHETQWLG